MSRIIPAAERIERARDLIQQARNLPVPAETGKYDFSYIAKVKDLLRQARDLVKFIPNYPSASDEMKNEVKKIFEEADQANKDILHWMDHLFIDKSSSWHPVFSFGNWLIKSYAKLCLPQVFPDYDVHCFHKKTHLTSIWPAPQKLIHFISSCGGQVIWIKPSTLFGICLWISGTDGQIHLQRQLNFKKLWSRNLTTRCNLSDFGAILF